MDMEDLINSENNLNFVPCLTWVGRGKAKARPDVVQITREEMVEIIQNSRARLQQAQQQSTSSQRQSRSRVREVNIDAELNMDNYDEDEVTNGLEQLGLQNIAEITAEGAEDNFNDDDSEALDDVIQPTDNLLLLGRVNGDASVLEVYVHNESEGSLYCHHDLFLPGFPLCMEWLDFEPGMVPGNYVAIGSMSTIIDVWDVDIVNCLEPAYSLGKDEDLTKNIQQVGHKDAVLGLAWNSNFHHILASGSVDETVLLWDIENGIPTTTYDDFKEKVQCVKWHPLEGNVLLAASSDKTAKVYDCRGHECKTWKINGEAERAIWSTTEPYIFYVGTSSGHLHCLDCRKGEIWSVQAHEKEISGLSLSSQCPGFLVTTATDGTIKVWDASGASKYSHQMVFEKELKMGMIHCMEMCPDTPFFYAAGGDNKSNNLTVASLMLYDPVKHYFESRPLKQLEVQAGDGQPGTSTSA